MRRALTALVVVVACLASQTAHAVSSLTFGGRFAGTGSVFEATYTRDVLNLGPFLPVNIYASTTARADFLSAVQKYSVTAGAGLTYQSKAGWLLDLRADYRVIIADSTGGKPPGLEASFVVVIPGP
jgi:hypothetical protein